MIKSCLLGVVCACFFTLVTITSHAATLPLESRLGGLAFYDPNLDITWATDANIGDTAGRTWVNAIAWVGGLTIGGISGWRLPSADFNGDGTVVNCSGGGVFGCADNEMGYLYHEEGITFATPGPFTATSGLYWTSTVDTSDSSLAWIFNNVNGGQGAQGKTNLRFAWAVHQGDVSAIPIPAAVWLFASGLIGLLGMGRRKR